MRQAVAIGLLALGAAACHKSCSYSGSTSISYGADAGTLSFTSPVDAAVDARAPTPPPETDAGGVPARFAGVFHLQGRVDEMNLALDRGGTFHWRLFFCDGGNLSCGQWAAKGALVVLTPTGTAETMDWVDAVSFNAQVTRVDVAEHGGHLEMRAYRPDGTSFAQVWLPGRVCAVCSGAAGGGPTTPPVPCDAPFPSTCP
ncbi:MAG TPA: hypothetical protein VF316_17920 [Polyangiaceae bacterium]